MLVCLESDKHKKETKRKRTKTTHGLASDTKTGRNDEKVRGVDIQRGRDYKC